MKKKIASAIKIFKTKCFFSEKFIFSQNAPKKLVLFLVRNHDSTEFLFLYLIVNGSSLDVCIKKKA